MVKLKIKNYINRFLIKILSFGRWRRIVSDSQELILKSEPNQYYESNYLKEELSYWLFIPKWIYELSKKGRILNCLDIGAAYGTLAVYTNKIHDCKTYCIDFTDEFMSKKLISDNNFNFKVCNIETDKVPFGVRYEMVIFTEVLEHLNFNPISTLKKIRSLMKDDGVLYVSTPDARDWGRVTKYYDDYKKIPEPRIGEEVIDDHVYQYNIDEFQHIVAAAGFRISKLKYSPGIVNRHINAELVCN